MTTTMHSSTEHGVLYDHRPMTTTHARCSLPTWHWVHVARRQDFGG